MSIHYIFSLEISVFYPLNKSTCNIFKALIFILSKVLSSQFENNKRLWHRVMQCMKCRRFEKKPRKFNGLTISLVKQDFVLIFPLLLRSCENIKIPITTQYELHNYKVSWNFVERFQRSCAKNKKQIKKKQKKNRTDRRTDGSIRNLLRGVWNCASKRRFSSL